MANYTTELYNVMKDISGLSLNPMEVRSISPLILKSWEQIFTPFKIWDENYREVLCTKILSHYYFQEIGSESPALFIFRLNRKMQEIMPYYNQLYRTQIENLDGIGTDIYEEYKANEYGDNRENNSSQKVSDTINKNIKDESANESFSGNTKNSKNASENTAHDINENTSVNGKSNSIDNSQEDTSSQDHSSKDENGQDTTNYNSTISNTNNNLKSITQYGSATTRSGSEKNVNSGDDWELFQDTPQGGLTGIKNENYLTNATHFKKGTAQTTTYNNLKDAKSGNDTTTTSGGTTQKHTGNDTLDHTLNGSEDASSTGTKNINSSHDGTEDSTTSHTGKNNDAISSTAEESSSSKSSKDNTLKTTDDFIGNVIEKSGYDNNGDYKKNNQYLRHTYGHEGSGWIDQILKWRESLINIDMMIIHELQSQFMGLW